MVGRVWGHRSLRWAVGFSVLLSAGCEHGPPAVEHGTVLAATPAHQAAESTGAGASAGAVIGGVAGGLVGGRGAAAALGAAIGIATGGLVGATAEGAAQSTDGVSYIVRIDDGRVVTVVQHQDANEVVAPPGSHVRITTEGQFQKVTLDQT